MLLQVSHRGRVDAAGTGAHDETVEGRDAHRCVDALAVLDRGDGRAVAEVAGDDLRAFEVDAFHLGVTLDEVLVGRTVGTVLAALVFFRKVLRNGEAVGILRHGAVEGVVEDDDLGFQVAEDFGAGVDALDVSRVVQRGQRGKLVDLFDDFRRDHDALVVDSAALNDPVADGSDLIEGVDDFALAFEERVLDIAERGGVVRKVRVRRIFTAVEGLAFDVAAGDADTFTEALGDDLLVLHVDELIFEGGAPAVDD